MRKNNDWCLNPLLDVCPSTILTNFEIYFRTSHTSFVVTAPPKLSLVMSREGREEKGEDYEEEEKGGSDRRYRYLRVQEGEGS